MSCQGHDYCELELIVRIQTRQGVVDDAMSRFAAIVVLNKCETSTKTYGSKRNDFMLCMMTFDAIYDSSGVWFDSETEQTADIGIQSPVQDVSTP